MWSTFVPERPLVVHSPSPSSSGRQHEASNFRWRLGSSPTRRCLARERGNARSVRCSACTDSPCRERGLDVGAARRPGQSYGARNSGSCPCRPSAVCSGCRGWPTCTTENRHRKGHFRGISSVTNAFCLEN